MITYSKKVVSGPVPGPVRDEFYNCLNVSAWPKQDALAAAMYSFTQMSGHEQLTIIQEVRKKFPVRPGVEKQAS